MTIPKGNKRKEDKTMLNTVEFGWIRIVKTRPSIMWDNFIDWDLIGEWEFWQLMNGEIVAYYIGDDE